MTAIGYRYNYTISLYEMHDFTTKDLLDNWEDIYRYAATEESEEDACFLADCIDVLNEKVLQLDETDRRLVMDRAWKDVRGLAIGESVFEDGGVKLKKAHMRSS